MQTFWEYVPLYEKPMALPDLSFEYSPHLCLGFLQVLWIPPTV